MSSQEQTFSILIVDDNPVNIDLLRRYLEGENYLISAVTSGEKALEIIPKINADLILLDIMMPGMDGYQTCKALKSTVATQNIPVIFVTAKIEPEDLRLGFSVGAADYITKPVNQDIVQARVKNQLTHITQARLEQRLLNENIKMAELGSMVAEVSHEVSSPLSTLTLSLDYLLEQTDSLKAVINQGKLSKRQLESYLTQMSESLTLCQNNGQRAASLMAGFKNIAVNQCTNQIVDFQLKKYIEEILLTLKPKLKQSNPTIKLAIAEKLRLNSYPGALSQIIINLVNNSLLHGFIDNNQGTITLSAKAINDGIELRYQDNGVGMSEEQQAKAFNRFYTTKSGAGGSGLGLSICKELVEQQLGGSLELQSAPNQGTTFIITLKNIAQASQ